MMFLQTIVEDQLSEVVIDKIFNSIPNEFQPNYIGYRGNTYIRENILNFNRAANSIPFLILTDLDTAECPPSLIRDWFGSNMLSSKLIFRIAEKSIESWVMADRISFSKYFGIPISKIPLHTDLVVNPKITLLNLVNSYSSKEIKEDIISKFNPNKQGPGYNFRLNEFVTSKWNCKRAAQNSKSLRKAITRLENYQ